MIIDGIDSGFPSPFLILCKSLFNNSDGSF